MSQMVPQDDHNWGSVINPRAVLVFLALTLLGGGIRLFVMETFPSRPIFDELYYLRVATNIAVGKGAFEAETTRAPRAFRPPGQAYLLSRFIPSDVGKPGAEPPTGDLLRKLLRVQVGLSTLIILLTALLAQALFNTRTGIFAGFMVAIYPNLIFFSYYFWSESLFTVLVMSALLLVIYGQRSGHPIFSFSAGVFFGLGALTREAAIPIAVMAALWWVCTVRKEKRLAATARCGIMLGVAALLVLPWTYRNYTLFHRIIPISTVSWFAAGEGNTFESPNWLDSCHPHQSTFRNRYFSIHDEMERMDFAKRYTLELIAAEQPMWIFKKAARNLAQLLAPDSQLLFKIRWNAYGKISHSVLLSLVLISVIPYIFIFVAGALGVAGAQGKGRTLFPCLIFGITILIHVLANAAVRFRMPWMPLFIIYAASASLNYRDLRNAMTRGKWIAVATVLIFFFGLCVPYFRKNLLALFS